MGEPAGRKAPVRIRVEDGEGFERTVLFEKKLLRIGSGGQTDLRLAHDSIAPCHVVILREGDGYSFADTSDSHSAFLNGKRASKGVLRHGDILTFGGGCSYRITFLTEGVRADDRMEMKLKTLLKASRAINSSLILDEVLERVIDAALEVTGAEKGFLMLSDGGPELRPRAARNVDLSSLVAEDLPASRTLIEQAVGSRRTVRFISGAEGIRSRTDSIMRLKLNTVVCTPILSKGEVIGVIYLDHRGVLQDLSGSEEEILEALADQASVAIQNARLTQEMLRAERLTAVGRMVSSIVHDLRGPLTGIQTAAQFLTSEPGGARSGRMLELIVEEVERMATMTQELLEFCRGNVRLEPKRTDLAEFLRGFVDTVWPNFEGGAFSLDLDAEEGIILDLDVRRMERVLRNLVTNALDAMPEGGRIGIEARAEADRAELIFRDTGCGMSDSQRRKVLEPFFTSGKENGTGLGLAIAHRVVEAHGGEIEVQSAPGEGTTLRICLPLRQPGGPARITDLEPAGAATS